MRVDPTATLTLMSAPASFTAVPNGPVASWAAAPTAMVMSPASRIAVLAMRSDVWVWMFSSPCRSLTLSSPLPVAAVICCWRASICSP